MVARVKKIIGSAGRGYFATSIKQGFPGSHAQHPCRRGNEVIDSSSGDVAARVMEMTGEVVDILGQRWVIRKATPARIGVWQLTRGS